MTDRVVTAAEISDAIGRVLHEWGCGDSERCGEIADVAAEEVLAIAPRHWLDWSAEEVAQAARNEHTWTPERDAIVQGVIAQAVRDERLAIIDLAKETYEEAGWCRECGSHALLTLREQLRRELTPEQAAAEHTRLSEELERDESTPSAADRSRWVDGLTKRPQ